MAPRLQGLGLPSVDKKILRWQKSEPIEESDCSIIVKDQTVPNATPIDTMGVSSRMALEQEISHTKFTVMGSQSSFIPTVAIQPFGIVNCNWLRSLIVGLARIPTLEPQDVWRIPLSEKPFRE